MPVLIAMGIGAVATTVSSQQKYQQDKKNAAITQRYSPWTGMHADTPDQPSMIGTAVQGGAQGAAMGQGIQNMQLQNQWLQQGYSPWGGGGMYGGGAHDPLMTAGYNAGMPGTFNYGANGVPSSYNSQYFGQIGGS